MRSRARESGDQGITIILVALCMIAILFIVALVIDYGNVRSSRQSNKLTTDVVAAAGLQSLAPGGIPFPWEAVCASLDYLEANQPDLAPSNITYRNGAGTVITGDPCSTALLLEQRCLPGTPTTWAWIRATIGDQVFDIKSGYVMPDPAFPEDAAEYAGDVGEPLQGGCDQLAVITSRTDDALFGGIGGRTDYSTASRTVGRVDIGFTPDVAIALVLLEQEDCQTLDFPSGSGALAVQGSANQAGIIHADSAGTGHDCGGNNVILEGKNSSGPRVRALSAPADPNKHGVISTFARSQGGNNDAHWTTSRVANATEVWLCDQDSGAAGPSPCADGPTGNRRVTRQPADDRYLTDVVDLRAEAAPVFSSIESGGVPAGYTRYSTLVGADCDLKGGDPSVVMTPLLAGTKLYVDCSTLSVGNGKLMTIGAGITDVAFMGNIQFSGTGTLDIASAERVFIHNQIGGSGADDAIATGSQGSFLLNRLGSASCEARHAADPDATTELVVRRGGIEAAAGGTVRLCSTFAHLMGGQEGASPVNTASVTYPAPYDNMSNNGTIEVQAGSNVDWTAPNTVVGTPPSQGDYRFEDLGLWSETQRDNFIGGGGTLVLSGVYFLPNTGPSDSVGGLTMVGGTSGAINLDAQLWARKLQFNGGAEFRMRSNPAEAITVPFLEGLGLVR